MASNNADMTAVLDADHSGLSNALKDLTGRMKEFEEGTGASLKNLDGMFKSAFGNMQGSIAALKNVFATAAPVLIFDYLNKETEAAIKQIREIGDLADKLGVSTDFFQTLKASAAEARTEFKGVQGGLDEFVKQLVKLKDGEGDLKVKLGAANADLVAQLKGASDVEGAIRLVSDRIKGLEDPYDKSALAAKLFGEEHADMARVIGEGSDALTRTGDEARRLGVSIDEHIIRQMQDAKGAFGSAAEAIDTKFKISLINLMPVLDGVADKTMALTGALGRIVDDASSVAAKTTDGLKRTLEADKALLAKETAEIMRLLEFDSKGYNSPGGIFSARNDDAIKSWTSQAKALVKEIQDIYAELDKRGDLHRTAPTPEGDDKDDTKKLLQGQQAMDDLMKRYYTDTHQAVQAIIIEQDKENQHFKQLMDDGKISWQQYQIALVTIAADANAKIKNQQDKTNEMLKAGMQGISSEFEKVLSSWQSGHAMTAQQIERDFAMMIEKMVLKAAILEPLFGTGKAGNNEFGAIGKGIQSIFGSGSGASGGTSGGSSGGGGLFSGIFHDGGVVGEGGFGRWIDPAAFAGAMRYHDGGIAGLLPGEVPAILQQGEGVISKDQMQGGGDLGGGHTFIANIQTPNPQAFTESQGQFPHSQPGR